MRARSQGGIHYTDCSYHSNGLSNKMGNLLAIRDINHKYIVVGGMEVMGPRPLHTRYLTRYSDEQRCRHDVRPGLSNPSTTYGCNSQTWVQQFEGDV